MLYQQPYMVHTTPIASLAKNIDPTRCRWRGQTNALSLGLLLCLALSILAGCVNSPTRYVEEHEIKQLTVVFLDEHSLREQWTKIAGRESVRLTAPMNSTTPVVKTVRGFYDYSSNTLYCEKWNFEVCGHELHHAALGQFHSQH